MPSLKDGFTGFMLAISLGLATALTGMTQALAQTTPDAAADSAAFPSATWQHLRKDDGQLSELGGGDVEAGLNAMGALGYQLFIVTTANDNGGAGYHFFRRPPWNRPVPRPTFTYRRIDDPGVSALGEGSFDHGLATLESEGWRLIAVTQAKGGAVGWMYFARETGQ